MADAASNGAFASDLPHREGAACPTAATRGHTSSRCTRCGDVAVRGYRYFLAGRLTCCDWCWVSPPSQRLVNGYYGIPVLQYSPN
jgi:hypothetical protein